ncbi:MAG: hypothetical protein KIT69_19665 [Propionibacteriaceae bacterium]|nr:hypothetical protein [Propionibacteriaceae bacterium]
MSVRTERRLQKEYTDFTTKQSNYKVTLEDDNLRIWNVCVIIQDGTNLKNNGVNELHYKMIFSDDYPSVGPKVMLVKPYIQAPFIFESGAICSDIFFKAGWSAMFSNIYIIDQMVQLIEKNTKITVDHEKKHNNDNYEAQMKMIGNAHREWQEFNG